MEQARIVKSAAEMRSLARRGQWRGATSGHCPAYQQANLVILPREAAAEFAAFCTRNPKPCPLIEITPPGDPEPARSAPGADLRSDVGGYRVYRKGELIEQRQEIGDLWRDDLDPTTRDGSDRRADLPGCTRHVLLIRAPVVPDGDEARGRRGRRGRARREA